MIIADIPEPGDGGFRGGFRITPIKPLFSSALNSDIIGWVFNRSSTATYLDSGGNLQTAAIDVPRFQTLGCLIENSKTNFLTYSDGNLSTYPTKSSSGVRDAAIPISGFTNSIEFYDPGTTRLAYKSYAVSVGNYYTISAFVEMDDGLAPVPGSNTTGDFRFIVNNGAVTPTYHPVQHIRDAIWRISGYVYISTYYGVNCGVAKYNTNSARTFRITGLNLTTGQVKSSYIPTEAASVTRSADSLKKTFGAGNFPQSFAVIMTVTPTTNGADYTTAEFRLFGTSDSGTNTVRTWAGSDYALAVSGAGAGVILKKADLLANTAYKIGISLSQEGANVRCIIAVNGTIKLNTAAAGTLDHSDTGDFFLGKYINDVFCGSFKDILFYNRGLSEIELARKTI